ncbi:cytochrome-c oxidase, cbb3-type subunit II [Pseudokordiimonas caeni]|uniref:cytochrome-c oxidase, cbb3-type subunit II n=1 Tax=Pseudokordiimonas caeni TaxID=2997908 RepID=UPI002811222B|nr:cytochrome-c oxidase, cbb3-type subunit II [Pseudokordiimonas caeni]
MAFNHGTIERNSILMLVLVLIVVAIGGLVEIVPLFLIKSTIEKVEGMRPYTPLELMGREIYIREGCYNCHSQMVRPLRAEVERYGHYSLAAESMYDHPFQWGSKRTGPDLARVGGKYSDEWHVLHMTAPSSVVPETVMPGYPFLASTPLKYEHVEALMKAHQTVGVPYSDEMVEAGKEDLEAQLDPFSEGYDGLVGRYGDKVQIRNFDTRPGSPTELDALVAYLQMLGTLVDFDLYKAEENAR